MRNKFHLYLRFCFLIATLLGCCTINAQIIEENSIKCFGDSTGQLRVYPDFGLAPYTYLWSNGLTNQMISGLKSDTFYVTVTDNIANFRSYSYILNDPSKITTTFTITPNSHWPVNTGIISINANGGTGWYKFSINDSTSKQITNQGNPIFDSLASGAYYITTSDFNNCLQFDTVHVPENAGLYVAIGMDTTACYRSTAPADVAPAVDGAYPMVVRFDNGLSVLIIDTVPGLFPYVLSTIVDTVASVGDEFEPGFHMVTVSASDGKGYRYSWTVDSVVAPISISWTQTNVLCFGKHTGSINSLAQGSYNGFTYRITGPGYSGISRIATGLYAGVHTITAEDYTGCILSQSVMISQPDEPLLVIFDDPVISSCQNARNGSININNVHGAANPVTYLWSDGRSTKGIDSLFAGQYIVTVTDAHGCTVKDSVKVNTNPEPLHVFFDIPVNANCPNSNNGEINIHRIEGATNPVSYLWSNGDTTQEITSLSPGSYTVSVTDVNHCMGLDSISVRFDNGSFLIIFDIPKNSSCIYTNDGEIKIISVDGVTNPVNYLWSNGSTNQEISSLAPGTYSVTVTDANNCTAQNSISVNAEKQSCVYNVVTPNGDGYNDYLDLSGLCYGLKMKAEIFNEYGKKITTLDENNPRWDGFDPSKPPTGNSSTFTVFIQIFKNDKLYVKFAESISVIYSK